MRRNSQAERQIRVADVKVRKISDTVKLRIVFARVSKSFRSFIGDTSKLSCMSSNEIKIRNNKIWQLSCTNSLQIMLIK